MIVLSSLSSSNTHLNKMTIKYQTPTWSFGQFHENESFRGSQVASGSSRLEHELNELVDVRLNAVDGLACGGWWSKAMGNGSVHSVRLSRKRGIGWETKTIKCLRNWSEQKQNNDKLCIIQMRKNKFDARWHFFFALQFFCLGRMARGADGVSGGLCDSKIYYF